MADSLDYDCFAASALEGIATTQVDIGSDCEGLARMESALTYWIARSIAIMLFQEDFTDRDF